MVLRVAGVALRAHTSAMGGAFMISGQAGASQSSNRDTNWPTAVASLAVGAGFLALWFWLLPPWLGFQLDTLGVARWRWIAVVPSVLGFAVAIKCIWDFGWTGHGTPVPIAPPQRLVVVGFYRHVRNPMYVGFFVGWLSLWVIFGRANRAALTVAIVAVAVAVLFARLVEEPILRRMFGAQYEDYCKNVPRWIPRVRAWNQ
jgi:protein-S-isoprenylcysteine O-methyltransferase Ste14